MIEDYQEQEQETGEALKISVHLQMQKLISIVLMTISKNFYKFYSHPYISLLTVDEFKTMLKHKRLSVTHEDDVAKAFYLWQQGDNNWHPQISAVIGDINWNYISLGCLIQLVARSPKLRANIDFQAQFKKEIQMRLKFNDDMVSKVSEPRYCYKFVNSNGFKLSNKTLSLVGIDEPFMKKMVVE